MFRYKLAMRSQDEFYNLPGCYPANPIQLRRPDLMVAWLNRLQPRPHISTRFIPQGTARAGYDTSERKKLVLRWVEARYSGNLPHYFDEMGRNIPFLPTSVTMLEQDPFLARGDLLGVHLRHKDGTAHSVYADVDLAQIENGGLAAVVDALDRRRIGYFLELSSSGRGIHVWICVGAGVPADKAAQWLKMVFTNAGVHKKGKEHPNQYDEVKPSDGDGGVIIVPHFQEQDRSTLVKLVDGKLVTLGDEEALVAMEGFQQNPAIIPEILATVVEKERKAKPTGRRSVAGAATAGGLRARDMSPEEAEREWDVLQWVLNRNDKIKKILAQAGSEKSGGRSEAVWQLMHNLIIGHDFHPDTVIRLLDGLPRYSEKSAAAEISRYLQKGEIAFYGGLTTVWRHPKITEANVSINTRSILQQLVEQDVSQLTRDLPVSIAASAAPGFRPKLTVYDYPPGTGKSLRFIPAVLLGLSVACATVPGPLATLFRERKADAVGMQNGLNSLRAKDQGNLHVIANKVGGKLKAIDSGSYGDNPILFSEERVLATAAYSFVESGCILAQGIPEEQEHFEAIRLRADRDARSPCVSQCPRIDCRSHPGYLKGLTKKPADPYVRVRCADARSLEPTPIAIHDERPHGLLRTHRIEISRKVDGSFDAGGLDQLIGITTFVGLDMHAAKLRAAKQQLVDAVGNVEHHPAEVYRQQRLPDLGWDADSWDDLRDRLVREHRDEILAAADSLLGRTPSYLNQHLHGLLTDARVLFGGREAIWLWSGAPSRKLEILVAYNRWAEVLATGTVATIIADGTASTHYEYAALPADVPVDFRRYPRLNYPNLTFTFDGKSITKGRGDSRAGEQATYAVQCVEQFLTEEGAHDLLIVTHKGAEKEIWEALGKSLVVSEQFQFGGRRSGSDKPALFVNHFGAITGSNEYRWCKGIVITHKHNLRHDDAMAISLTIFGDVHVLRVDGNARKEATLARQWTPLRRGKTGKNRGEPAIYSQQFDACFSREIDYVLRSALATDIVQAIQRTAVRDDDAARVRVFFPLGQDTALATAILRELPGAVVG